LALVAIGAGLLLYWLGQPRRQLVATGAISSAGAGGIFTGGDPLTGPARLPASDFSLIIRQGLAPFYQWANVDRYYLAVWQFLLRLSDRLGRASQRLERYAIPALLALGVTVLVATVSYAGQVGDWSGGDTADLAGSTTFATSVSDWPLIIGVGLALLALVMAAVSTLRVGRATLLMVGAGLLALAGLGVEQPLLRLCLLEAAALVALILVWQTATNRAVGRVYLFVVLLSAALTIGGLLMLDTVLPQLALALLLTGLAFKLALVPLYLWLPQVAEMTPAVVVGLVVAVIDVAAFGELLALRQSVPWLFAPAIPWLALAVLSALGGAVLMLAQRDLKRLLAFSTIEDMGFLLLGLTLGGELGLAGAVLGVIVHALAKALLFISLSTPEASGGSLTLAVRGLARRYPISGAGFLVGALAVLGIPPTLGYAAHWRLYGAAAQVGTPLLFVLLLATALAVLAYVRAIAKCWWGSNEQGGEIVGGTGGESMILKITLAGLSLILLLAGLWPGLISLIP
jgi:multicomponent Na+:H+ antiporter subunit D